MLVFTSHVNQFNYTVSKITASGPAKSGRCCKNPALYKPFPLDCMHIKTFDHTCSSFKPEECEMIIFAVEATYSFTKAAILNRITEN